MKSHTAKLAQAEPQKRKGSRRDRRTRKPTWQFVARMAALLMVLVLLGANVDDVRRAATFAWLKRLVPMTRVEVRPNQTLAQSRTPEEMLRGALPGGGGAGSSSSGQAASTLSRDSLRSAIQRGAIAAPELPSVLVDVKEPVIDAARVLDRATGAANSRVAGTPSQGVAAGRIADSRNSAASAKSPPVRVPTLIIGGNGGEANASASGAAGASGTAARVDQKLPALVLLTVPADSKVYVDGVLIRDKNQVAVAPGSHDITVLSGATRVQKRISLAAGDTVTVRLALP